MRSSNPPKDFHLNTSFLMWLNQQEDKQKNEEWMLDVFLFFLTKFSRHESIRLDHHDFLHQRFWKGMEDVLEYQLMSRRKKPKDIVLYQFIENVALTENWIRKENNHAVMNEQGRQFLALTRKNQWNRILAYIWPDP
ncbi:hypothetical protein [Salibacterium halotolerans]|uniref:Uncharacterized protein n=1 Tax=Salibacterium halotolerans TaxID=1884432 RepID=A0A1I5NX31_9BACI|nr:hypothetical protein [Salibacterium halotolerans]SFP26344.1 hypothetical protein SAMN05518683_103312 [Salibacterium halotolerans]